MGQRKGSCGPASLKMVFDYWGKTVSEIAIARVAGTTVEKGTTKDGLIRAASHFGFNAIVKENASLDDLRNYIKQGIPVVVNWFLGDDGHYSVVVSIDKNNVFLADPAMKKPLLYGNIRRISCKKFYRVWFDFPGDFIKDPKDLILRLMIIFTPKEEWEVLK